MPTDTKLIICHRHRFRCAFIDGIFEGDFNPVEGFLSIAAMAPLNSV